MITIKNISKSFGRIKALDGVSLEIKAGQVTGLVGPNGCGKTTLLKSILGLVLLDEGEIFIQDLSIQNGWKYRKNLGYMPQNPDFPDNLSIKELLDLLEDIREKKALRREELLKLFGLHSDENRLFGVLSGGTKQKVAAIAAFMFDSPILILDEPTVGLDPVSAQKFKILLKNRVQEGGAILLVSHIMSEMEQMADKLIFMLDGKIDEKTNKI